MTPEEVLNILESLVAVTIATPDVVEQIFSTYKVLINPNARLCSSCPQSIRQAHGNLVQYYQNNKERLKKEIKDGKK